uniref:hypothetical protein n=1 Tax=Streptomyces chartreusis TaxID=1969 RepID=UPI003F49B33E
MITRPTIAGLHPAQCRAPLPHGSRRTQRTAHLCRARLDQQPPGPAEPLPEELAALQKKITTMLSPDTPAAMASEYFADLQITSGLVMITRPMARPHRSGAGRSTGPLALHPCQRATPDARACACILLAADAILSASDQRTALAPLAPVENRTRSGIDPKRHHSWDTAFRRYQDDCSQRFQDAAEYLVSTHRRSGRGGSRLPQCGLGYGPQHVPAFLPLEWAERHLGAFTAAFSMPVLRRTTSAFLVRRALGKTIVDAAEFLGLGIDGKGLGGPITRWARRQGTPEAYERALDAIAAELASSPPIDYRNRRTLLADWAPPPDTWHQIADQLKRRPSRRYISDNRAHLAATAYIWTQVTHGETQFAPQPAEARNTPELDAAWSQDRFTVGHWIRQNKVPFYQQMKPLLDAYTAQLTRAGDTARSTRQLKRSVTRCAEAR